MLLKLGEAFSIILILIGLALIVIDWARAGLRRKPREADRARNWLVIAMLMILAALPWLR